VGYYFLTLSRTIQLHGASSVATIHLVRKITFFILKLVVKIETYTNFVAVKIAVKTVFNIDKIFSTNFKTKEIMAILDETNGIIDPKDISVRPSGLRWGLIWGLVGVVLSLLFTVTGLLDPTKNSFFSIPNLLNWASSITIVYMALVAHRNEELGGYITLGRCVGLGAFMGLIAGVITAIYMFVYFGYINPDFMSKIIEAQIDQAEAKGQDPERVRQAMEMTKAFMTPGAMSILGLITSVMGGVIWGLLIGLIVRKDPPRPF
jgi:Protein of unknown function (DUF4199)